LIERRKTNMKRRRLEVPYNTPSYSLSRHPEGVLVEDKLAKQSYVVCVTSGRFVGRCTCGSTDTDPWNSCRHQSAVRTYLMGCCFGRRNVSSAASD
jgi:hypothetical protein